jgi:hypothetical protein
MLRSRVITATGSVLGALLVAPACFAASSNIAPVSGATALMMEPAATVLLDTKGQFLPLASFAAPALRQDLGTARPNGFTTNLTQDIKLELANGRNWASFGNLFPSPGALSSDYLSGTTAFAGASFALTTDLELSFGRSELGFGALSPDQPSGLARDLAERLGDNLRDTSITSASISWNFADWAGLAITGSQSSGNPTLLGVISGPTGAAGTAETLSLGISARVGFGEGWVTTVAYSGAVTQLDLSRSGLLPAPETLRSQGFGLSLAKQGLFGADAIGISVSRPLQVYTGALGAALAGTQARESDVQLGYVTSFLDGSLALQANAGYQLNAAGNKGEEAVTGVARAKLKF